MDSLGAVRRQHRAEPFGGREPAGKWTLRRVGHCSQPGPVRRLVRRAGGRRDSDPRDSGNGEDSHPRPNGHGREDHAPGPPAVR